MTKKIKKEMPEHVETYIKACSDCHPELVASLNKLIYKCSLMGDFVEASEINHLILSELIQNCILKLDKFHNIEYYTCLEEELSKLNKKLEKNGLMDEEDVK